MAIKIKFRPGTMVLVLPLVLLVLFLVLFIDTCSDYGRVREFKAEMKRNPFALSDLNKYRKLLAGKTQKLHKLRRVVKVDFRPSELKEKLEAMARLSSIPVNNISIDRFTIRKQGGLQRLLVDVRVKTSFPRLGAFISRLEKATVSRQDSFEYVLRVERLDIAVIKLYERTLSARLFLAVYRKGDG